VKGKHADSHGRNNLRSATVVPEFDAG
jgi:hypothetical protein